MLYIFTLDSHDYFGPFKCEAHAHDWARRKAKRSYQLTRTVGWRCEVLKPY